MGQNHTCWWASCAVRVPKQCTCLCFGGLTAQLAHQHVWFCIMWLGCAKGLLKGYLHQKLQFAKFRSYGYMHEESFFCLVVMQWIVPRLQTIDISSAGSFRLIVTFATTQHPTLLLLNFLFWIQCELFQAILWMWLHRFDIGIKLFIFIDIIILRVSFAEIIVLYLPSLSLLLAR